MPKNPSSSSEQPPECPRCGTRMVRRVAQRGKHQGTEFWGCPKFPKCWGRSPTQPPVNPDNLEIDEPDATGRWDPDHRRQVLRYVYDRDGERCGICAAKMKLKGALIDHVVPKVFAVFDIRRGRKAVTGTRYTSRLHKPGNLQAAHTYCNRGKGNKPEIVEWRHPSMPPPPLVVAKTKDGKELIVPPKSRWPSRRR